MSVETSRQTMEGYLDALLHGGDFARYFADDVLWLTPETGEEIRGRDAVRDYIVAFHTRVFDAHPEMKSLVVAEGAACVEADFVGTHTGDFAGIEPTGAKLTVPYCMVYDLDGDTITALRGYLPVAAMAAQLRAAKA
jgi:predicted ester cyclase